MASLMGVHCAFPAIIMVPWIPLYLTFIKGHNEQDSVCSKLQMCLRDPHRSQPPPNYPVSTFSQSSAILDWSSSNRPDPHPGKISSGVSGRWPWLSKCLIGQAFYHFYIFTPKSLTLPNSWFLISWGERNVLQNPQTTLLQCITTDVLMCALFFVM